MNMMLLSLRFLLLFATVIPISFCASSSSSLEIEKTINDAITPTSNNVTMYHIHSKSFGKEGDPSNMNLGDLAGDLFFDVAEIMMLLPCSEKSTKAGPKLPGFVACNNQEYWSNDSVISQLVVAVKEPYGHYAACNVCTPEGTSPVNPTNKCHPGDYVCDCRTEDYVCTDPRVGRTDMGVGHYFHDLCRDPKYSDRAHKFFCAIEEAANRIGGYWYDTLQIGKGTTWSVVKSVKTIDKQCHQESFLSTIEAHGDPICFQSCPPRIVGQQPDLCYVDCFIQAALGQPQGNDNSAAPFDGGMSKEELMMAWSNPFVSSDPKDGGCPDIGKNTRNHHPRGYAAEIATALSHMVQLL